LLKRFQKWVTAKAGTDQALWALALTSFLESAFMPFPVEAVSLPVMMANLRRVWLVALIATTASVTGGALGYAIGLFLFDTVGVWLIKMYGLTDAFQLAQAHFTQWGWTWVMIGGITPMPYKVISIASGVASLSFVTFMAASLVSRGIRFAAFACCFWFFGQRLQVYLERHSGLISFSMILLMLAGFAVMLLF
jgi:membrane protein YqaA with SNARE-associated domain